MNIKFKYAQYTDEYTMGALSDVEYFMKLFVDKHGLTDKRWVDFTITGEFNIKPAVIYDRPGLSCLFG